MVRLIVLLLLAGIASAQSVYTYEKATAATTSEKVTIHLPADSVSSIRFVGATAYCSAGGTATLTRDGTAPTTTLATVVKLNNNAATSAARAYHASNVGSGTHIKTYNLAAGFEQAIELPDKSLLPGENLTIATSCTSGDNRIYFQWRQ